MPEIDPVNDAMAAKRPAKNTIRQIWSDEVRFRLQDESSKDVPWYLTLPGAEGYDIEKLIEDGVIEVTEIGAISPHHAGKIVAVESKNEPIRRLYRKFAGLKVREVNFGSFVNGTEIFNWPNQETRHLCRAKVINLDLNTAFRLSPEQAFPSSNVLQWIRKLCALHARNNNQGSISWTLCLTLHGEIVWEDTVNLWARNFIKENVESHDDFARNVTSVFTPEIVAHIMDHPDPPDFTSLEAEAQQKAIMILVPKIISSLVKTEGWEVNTTQNLKYGGNGVAPMVTWVIRFEQPEGLLSTAEYLYRTSISQIFSRFGTIHDDGRLEYL